MYNLKSFEQRVNELTPDKLKILAFEGVKFPVTFECLKCHEIQTVKRGEVLLRKGKLYQCQNCHYTKEQTTLATKHKLENFCKTQNIKLVNFEQVGKLAQFECQKCGKVFERTPNDFLHGRTRCPNCSENSQELTLYRFQKKLTEVRKDDYQVVNPESYVNGHTKILMRHSCGFIWYVKPTKLLYQTNCPKCAKKISKGEKRIEQFLIASNIEFIWQKKEKIEGHTLFFDFYLPQSQTYIEYQGEQHYSPVEYFGGIEHHQRQVENDHRKERWCLKNNYTLLTISYKDYESIEEILKVQRL